MKNLLSIFVKKFMGIALIIFILGKPSYSQSTFQKTYSLQISGFAFDDIVRDVIIDSQENFVFTGYVKEFGSQGTEAFLSKSDKDGNILFYKGYYDSIQNNSTTFGSLIETSDGGYLLIGSNPSISLGLGGTIVKVDSSGSIQWIKRDLTGDELGISKLSKAVNGDIIGVGTVNNNSIGRFLDATIARFDINGNLLWGKCFGTNGSEYGNDIIGTFDNGCVIIGTTNPSSMNAGNDIYLVKFDSLGNHIWSKNIGGNDDDGNIYFTSIIETSDGNLIIVAPTKSFGFGNYDILIIKIDNLGNTIWTKVHGTSNTEIPNAVEELANGDILICGSVGYPSILSSEAIMIRLNNSGNILWGKSFNYLNFNNLTNFIISNNYYLSVGETNDGGSISDIDIYVVKTDPTGISGCNENNYLLSSVSIGINSQNIADSVFDRGSFVNGTISVFDYTPYFVENTLCFVGIDEYDLKDNIIFYPNPSLGKFKIKTNDNLYKELKVYNLIGELVYNGRLQQEITNIDISFLTPGLYFLNLINPSTFKQTTLKIIINH